MADKAKLDTLTADAEEMASVVASVPQDQRALLRAVTKAVVLGAQIAEQCQQATKEAS